MTWPRGCACSSGSTCTKGEIGPLADATASARFPRLLNELAIARADGSYVAVLHRIAQVHVLVLDHLLIAPIEDTKLRNLLTIDEDEG